MAKSLGNLENLLNEEGEFSEIIIFTCPENPLQDPHMKKAEGEISSLRSSVVRKITAIRKSIDVVVKAKEGLDNHKSNPIVLNKCKDGADSISEPKLNQINHTSDYNGGPRVKSECLMARCS